MKFEYNVIHDGKIYKAGEEVPIAEPLKVQEEKAVEDKKEEVPIIVQEDIKEENQPLQEEQTAEPEKEEIPVEKSEAKKETPKKRPYNSKKK